MLTILNHYVTFARLIVANKRQNLNSTAIKSTFLILLIKKDDKKVDMTLCILGNLG
jgi:hypothetical protein